MSPGRPPVLRATSPSMDPVYIQLRERARQIVSRQPSPRFYRACSDAWAGSVNFYATDPIVGRLRRFVTARLDNDFGHGLRHAVKVTLDAGALVLVESAGPPPTAPYICRRLRAVQCAALLHDIRRKSRNHARAGAEYARSLLDAYPLPPETVNAICGAIRNHEAFQACAAAPTREAQLISDCLYDADKFRWGADNFRDTIWDMVAFARVPPETFLRHYPRGMQSLTRIRSTFRSHTGRRYGPEFIDQGIVIGWQLYEEIREAFQLG